MTPTVYSTIAVIEEAEKPIYPGQKPQWAINSEMSALQQSSQHGEGPYEDIVRGLCEREHRKIPNVAVTGACQISGVQSFRLRSHSHLRSTRKLYICV